MTRRDWYLKTLALMEAAAVVETDPRREDAPVQTIDEEATDVA
ncbi:hypothetical protein [Nonomuraea sp. PA05]|nr:hypothetical protein [Nonomuraea sp. PA05]